MCKMAELVAIFVVAVLVHICYVQIADCFLCAQAELYICVVAEVVDICGDGSHLRLCRQQYEVRSGSSLLQCPLSALSVPSQCPLRCPHSALW